MSLLRGETSLGDAYFIAEYGIRYVLHFELGKHYVGRLNNCETIITVLLFFKTFFIHTSMFCSNMFIFCLDPCSSV